MQKMSLILVLAAAIAVATSGCLHIHLPGSGNTTLTPSVTLPSVTPSN
ncbi:hypothetical protein FACS189418_4270 [Clostridia bacterium]|nr:hypothetical protein FACS189418_4270 [Clostridia bacterium]